ncbi:DUF2721 domain-containing protein [Pelagicoccus sp. SDUM812003]|uniref:DUF2721 domain-containing protein n=1 Tax=Pelagicoccus sp. SDUM812003 TaxID=3041267 RepID=UPI00280D9A3A|nr:DUF2721 domain-containing protein [Pelagicoccus sp. SDUM812003]MDQ8204281.1 DUF2721 domain-containing protein [Pelagicoccus sp. SDUM812003]
MDVNELVPTLQLAIGPMILISGIGLILLSMTNRYGRVTDRARALRENPELIARLPANLAKQESAILAKRARAGRFAIMLISLSLLFAALLVCVLFAISFWTLDWAWLIVVLFAACMGSFVAALAVFLHDVNLSLKTFHLSESAFADL